MKSRSCITLLFVAVTCAPFTGCVFKTATVTPRHFVLAPIATNEPAPVPVGNLSVGIARVKMPPYLLRDSIAIRDGANEIGYLENAAWGERLDQCFQRTLAANLARSLSSDSVYLTDWAHDQAALCVIVNIQQFDVDTRGRGTLIAQWQIKAPDHEIPVRSGRAELAQNGASPHGHPEVIATTLSELAAEFSRELAQPLRESAQSSASFGAAESKSLPR